MAHLFHVFSFSFTSLSTSAASAMPKCHASTLTEQFADLNKTYTNLNQPSFLHLHQVNSRSVVGRLGTAQNWCGFSLLLPVAKSSFFNIMNILKFAEKLIFCCQTTSLLNIPLLEPLCHVQDGPGLQDVLVWWCSQIPTPLTNPGQNRS